MTKKNSKELAKKIKIYMLQNGISQRDLAKKMNLTPASISKFLTGNNSLRTDTLDKLAKALGTHTNYFFADDSNTLIGNHNIQAAGIADIDLQKEIELIKKELEIHRYKLENLELKIDKQHTK